MRRHLSQQAQLSGQAPCPALAIARAMGDREVLCGVWPALGQRHEMVQRHRFARNGLAADVADAPIALVDCAAVDPLDFGGANQSRLTASIAVNHFFWEPSCPPGVRFLRTSPKIGISRVPSSLARRRATLVGRSVGADVVQVSQVVSAARFANRVGGSLPPALVPRQYAFTVSNVELAAVRLDLVWVGPAPFSRFFGIRRLPRRAARPSLLRVGGSPLGDTAAGLITRPFKVGRIPSPPICGATGATIRPVAARRAPITAERIQRLRLVALRAPLARVILGVGHRSPPSLAHAPGCRKQRGGLCVPILPYSAPIYREVAP